MTTEHEALLREHISAVLDRIKATRKIIDHDGLMVALKSGTKKAHPLLRYEQDQRALLIRLLREVPNAETTLDEELTALLADE